MRIRRAKLALRGAELRRRFAQLQHCHSANAALRRRCAETTATLVHAARDHAGDTAATLLQIQGGGGGGKKSTGVTR